MKKNPKYLFILAFLILIVFLVVVYFCYIKKPVEILNTGRRVEFRFQDSSVPPQYHRSYDITLTDDGIKIVVDSYGDILNEKSFSLSKDTVNNFFDNLDKYNFTVVDSDTSDIECTGGTSKSLKIYDENGLVTLEGYSSSCGDEDTGTLQGDIDGLANDLQELIPNFDNIIK